MKEIWKDIEDYEGLYQVSNLGRVCGVERDTIHWNGSINVSRHRELHIMSLMKNKRGYLYVGLCKNGHRRGFTVHRLVAKAFVKNPHHYNHVNHKDENKENNHADNLEWCSLTYNNRYGTKYERQGASLRKRNNTRQIVQLTLSGKEIARFHSAYQAAKETGADERHIKDVCQHHYGCKTHFGYRWKFADT